MVLCISRLICIKIKHIEIFISIKQQQNKQTPLNPPAPNLNFVVKATSSNTALCCHLLFTVSNATSCIQRIAGYIIYFVGLSTLRVIPHKALNLHCWLCNCSSKDFESCDLIQPVFVVSFFPPPGVRSRLPAGQRFPKIK